MPLNLFSVCCQEYTLECILLVLYVHIFSCSHAGYIMQHGPIQVFVKPDVPNALLFLMEQYADMLLVLSISELPATCFLKLKMFLSGYCNETLF